MQQDFRATSRRVFVRTALTGLAGTLGAGAVAQAASARAIAPSPAVPAALQPATITKVLFARNLLEGTADADADGRTDNFDTLILRGELAEEPEGESTGRMHGLGFVLHGLVSRTAAEYEILIIYTFTLQSGSIIGLGTLTEQSNTFAIVGGTGDYLGAQGSFTVDLTSAADGSQTAQITMALIAHQVFLPNVRKDSNG